MWLCPKITTQKWWLDWQQRWIIPCKHWPIVHNVSKHSLCPTNWDDCVYAPSQWETTLQCNVVSHWLGAYKKWSLSPWPMWDYLKIVNELCQAMFLWATISVILSLTHWGLVTHICVSKLTIIGSDNGLSPERRQAIIWTNAGILLIGTIGTNFSEILIRIQIFSFKKMHLKMSSAKWHPFCLSLNELTHCGLVTPYGIGLGNGLLPDGRSSPKPMLIYH